MATGTQQNLPDSAFTSPQVAGQYSGQFGAPNLPGTPGYDASKPTGAAQAPNTTPQTTNAPATSPPANSTNPSTPTTTPTLSTVNNTTVGKVDPNMPNTATGNTNFGDTQAQTQQALQQAQASGPAPQSAGEASGQVSGFMSSANAGAADIANSNAVNQKLQQDPAYQQLLTDYSQLTNTQNSQQTMTQIYQGLIQSTGLQGIDTQLVNWQNVMNGTQDDIRKEVSAAGGQMTNSQVLAMSAARNQGLQMQYNNLLNTEKMITDRVNTMMSLTSQDQATAINNIKDKINLDSTMFDTEQKMTAASQEGYKNVISAVGYSGLYNSLLNSDPSGYTLSQAEQTLGFAPGTLSMIATQEKSQANLQVIQASGATSPYVVNSNGEVMNTTTGLSYTSPQDFQQQTGQSLQDAINSGAIQPLPPNIEQQTKLAQEQKAITDAQYAGAINQANITQSNASAASSAATTAKTKVETNQLLTGTSPTDTKAVADAGQKIQSDAAALIEKMNTTTGGFMGIGSKHMSWATAFNTMHASYPDLSNETIDNLLQKNNYGNK
jgi:hypothetical protein